MVRDPHPYANETAFCAKSVSRTSAILTLESDTNPEMRKSEPTISLVRSMAPLTFSATSTAASSCIEERIRCTNYVFGQCTNISAADSSAARIPMTSTAHDASSDLHPSTMLAYSASRKTDPILSGVWSE